MTPASHDRLFDDAATMEATLAADLATRLAAQIETTGAASFAAAGGSTPGGVYDRLARAPIAWKNVVVTPSDERWVGEHDPASNAHMLAAKFLQGPAAAARFVGLTTADADPRAAEPAIEARVGALPAPFAAVLVGMGEDGHFASLFPGATQLAAALDLDDPARVRAIGPLPNATGAAWRMTLTLRALTDALGVIVLIRGDAKLRVYEAARNARSLAAAPPIAALVRQRRAPVTLYWAP